MNKDVEIMMRAMCSNGPVFPDTIGAHAALAEAVKAALAAQGYAIVPVEPTGEMLSCKAGPILSFDLWEERAGLPNKLRTELWQAMIQAAQEQSDE